MNARIFLNTLFQRFARRERIEASVLIEAIARAERGLIDANLGGGIIKQRIARRGQGKSGGYRSLVAFYQGERAFFLYGFAKSGRQNISDKELETYKDAASVLLALSEEQLNTLVREGKLKEIK
ncbi:MAG: type II toxin-antitoxin system RelE/ParE family toxin [Cyanobacteria bacterium P01_E01_bin.45]